MGDNIFSTVREVRQVTREVANTAREVGRTSDEIARARGAVEGHDGVRHEARDRRDAAGERAGAQLNRATEARIRAQYSLQDTLGGQDNSNSNRYQPSGNNNQSNSGLGQGQSSGGTSNNPSNVNPGQQFVDAVAAANMGSAEGRADALRLAGQFRQPDGRIQLPAGSYGLPSDRNGRPISPLQFDATDIYASPEAAVTFVSGYLAGTSGIGSAVNAGAAAAPPTVSVGTTPPGTAAPDTAAPGNARYNIPAAVADAARARTFDGKPQMQMTEDQVKAFQTAAMAAGGPLGDAIRARGGADGKPGTATYAALAAAFDPQTPESINFGDPTQLAAAMTRLNAAPATATPATTAPATAAPTAARVAEAVNVLDSLTGADNIVSAGEIATVRSTNGAAAIATAFDLNNSGRVEATELAAIETAAQARGITVEGGAAALAPLFPSAPAAAAAGATLTGAAAQTPPTPSALFEGRGFSPEAKESALVGAGFAGVVRDGVLSQAELAMGGKLEVAAGTVSVVDDRAALGQLQQAAQVAQRTGTTLAAKADAGQVYNPTSHEFAAAPATPDARSQVQRDNARAGTSV